MFANHLENFCFGFICVGALAAAGFAAPVAAVVGGLATLAVGTHPILILEG